MRNTPFVVALVVWAGVGLAQIGAAQTAARLMIHNVTLHEGSGVLTVTGTGLGAELVVTVDGQPVAVLLGATATQVEVLAPATVLTTPGTYRLTVVDPVRQAGDAFVVASQAGSVIPAGSAAHGAPPAAPRELAALSAGARAAKPVDGAARLQLTKGVSPLLIEQDSNPWNTALGAYALGSNIYGLYNTAFGIHALYSNFDGGANAASGAWSLYSNTEGYENTASGYSALFSNTTGSRNTASGSSTLYSNTTGGYNTASGYGALYSNTTGWSNMASGSFALYSNTGQYNTASGTSALYSNTAGVYNTASGMAALYSNTTGRQNTASGESALSGNTTGEFNAALGAGAGSNATTGSHNLFLGTAVTGTATDTNTIRIGLPYAAGVGQNQTFIAGIHGTELGGSGIMPVYVNANGQLGMMSPQVLSGTGTVTSGTATGPAAPLQLQGRDQQQLRELQTTIADLRARLARLEALVMSVARR